MTKITIFQPDGKTVVEDVEFVDCLLNVNNVSADGEIYDDVVQVRVED